MKLKKKKYLIPLGLLLGYFILNSIRIYNHSFEQSEKQSDVAIVLGAAISDGELSPVFRERINHGIYIRKALLTKSFLQEE